MLLFGNFMEHYDFEKAMKTAPEILSIHAFSSFGELCLFPVKCCYHLLRPTEVLNDAQGVADDVLHANEADGPFNNDALRNRAWRHLRAPSDAEMGNSIFTPHHPPQKNLSYLEWRRRLISYLEWAPRLISYLKWQPWLISYLK